jgi:GntR family transcriptional regulator
VFDDGSPIYRQIAERIKADILRGVLEGDEQVMSTNQYATYYRINPATAAKAFQQLVDDGLLYKRRGVGMFVSPDAPETLHRQHRARFYADVVDPMVAEARTLGLDLHEVADRIRELAEQPAPVPTTRTKRQHRSDHGGSA